MLSQLSQSRLEQAWIFRQLQQTVVYKNWFIAIISDPTFFHVHYGFC